MTRNGLQPGDLVVYTNAWLYATGQAPTGSACRDEGVVVDRPDLLGGLSPERFIVVHWRGENTPRPVSRANVGRRRSARVLDVPAWASR